MDGSPGEAPAGAAAQVTPWGEDGGGGMEGRGAGGWAKGCAGLSEVRGAARGTGERRAAVFLLGISRWLLIHKMIKTSEFDAGRKWVSSRDMGDTETHP